VPTTISPTKSCTLAILVGLETLGAGSARLVLEPVPLFDRAVSAALDELAAQKPASGSVAAAA